MSCSKDLQLEGTETQIKNGGKLGGRFLLYAKRPTHKKYVVCAIIERKLSRETLVQSGSKS